MLVLAFGPAGAWWCPRRSRPREASPSLRRRGAAPLPARWRPTSLRLPRATPRAWSTPWVRLLPAPWTLPLCCRSDFLKNGQANSIQIWSSSIWSPHSRRTFVWKHPIHFKSNLSLEDLQSNPIESRSDSIPFGWKSTRHNKFLWKFLLDLLGSETVTSHQFETGSVPDQVRSWKKIIRMS